MFAQDRDLLALEPNLLRDVAWHAQQVASGTGSISGTTLTLTIGAVNFEEGGVEAGHVVLVDGVVYEVLTRTSATTLTVSRIRDDPAGPAIAPTPATSKPVYVYTFRPQIGIVHRRVMRMLGIEPDTPEAGQPTAASITNPGAFRLIEALGTLAELYRAAMPADASYSEHEFCRYRIYAERFEAERQRVAARLDLDGDGVPDATRRLNVMQFVRG